MMIFGSIFIIFHLIENALIPMPFCPNVIYACKKVNYFFPPLLMRKSI
jgi:hypothetical protein